MACFDARVGSTRASQCPDCDEVREHCVNAPLATWFLGPPRPTDTKTHTHTLHIPHIVFFFDNSFSYIMNPIHIKGWTGGSTGVAPSPPEWAKTAWENKLFPLFLPPLLFVTPQRISSVRRWTCVADHVRIKQILQRSPNMLRCPVRFRNQRECGIVPPPRHYSRNAFLLITTAYRLVRIKSKERVRNIRPQACGVYIRTSSVNGFWWALLCFFFFFVWIAMLCWATKFCAPTECTHTQLCQQPSYI